MVEGEDRKNFAMDNAADMSFGMADSQGSFSSGGSGKEGAAAAANFSF